jgi:hypothetical protein
MGVKGVGGGWRVSNKKEEMWREGSKDGMVGEGGGMGEGGRNG